TVPHLAERVKSGVASWAVKPRILVDSTEKLAAFRQARAALAASGTVTLELAIAGIPSVVAYKVSMISEWIYRMFVRLPTILLANLLLEQDVMPQIVQRQATPERLAAALAPLIGETAERKRQLDAFAKLDPVLGIGAARPSELAADIVLDVVRRHRGDHFRREIGA